MEVTKKHITGRADFINGEYYKQPKANKVCIEVEQSTVTGQPESWTILLQRGKKKPVLKFCEDNVQALFFLSGIEAMLKH